MKIKHSSKVNLTDLQLESLHLELKLIGISDLGTLYLFKGRGYGNSDYIGISIPDEGEEALLLGIYEKGLEWYAYVLEGILKEELSILELT